MNMQANFSHTHPMVVLPAQIIEIIDNFYDSRGDLIFQPMSVLLEIAESDLFKTVQAALKLDDESAAVELSIAINRAVRRHSDEISPFSIGAVGDLMFNLDKIAAFHESLIELSEPFERWVGDQLLYRANSWTKLQFVLAADYYSCDHDMLGLVVGHAWKAGKMHGLLSSNFGQKRCSKWLEASSQRGLNALEPAPSSPLNKTLYRGGAQSSHLAHELSWSEDKEIAVFFAERQGHGEPMVVSTQSGDSRVLARFEHESEVLLAYDATRQFKVELI